MTKAKGAPLGRVKNREAVSTQGSTSRIFFALVRLAIGIAIILYLVKSGSNIAAIALLLLDVGLIALRLCWLFRPAGMTLPWYNSLQLTLVSFFFAAFLPGAAGGDLARIFYAAKGNAGRRIEIVTVLIFDRAIGLFSLLLLPLLFASMFPELWRSFPAVRLLLIAVAVLAAGMLGVFLILFFKPSLVNQRARQAGRPFPCLGTVERILGTIAVYRRSPRTLLAALGISVVANLSLIAVTALGVLALNPASWAMKMCVMIPIGHVVNSVPLTPGGLGVGETAFNALFEAVGLRGGAETLLCWRIWRTFVSVLGLAIYLRGFKLSVSVTEVIPSSHTPSAAPRLPSE
jgi:uncharacterized protein (TIRG00374 family)